MIQPFAFFWQISKFLKDKAQGKLKTEDEQIPRKKLRSSKWPALQKEHLKRQWCCCYCGSVFKLQVHHIQPFHLEPTKELDPQNLITLCEDPVKGNCHLSKGHLGNFKKANPEIALQCRDWGFNTKNGTGA